MFHYFIFFLAKYFSSLLSKYFLLFGVAFPPFFRTAFFLLFLTTLSSFVVVAEQLIFCFLREVLTNWRSSCVCSSPLVKYFSISVIQETSPTFYSLLGASHWIPAKLSNKNISQKNYFFITLSKKSFFWLHSQKLKLSPFGGKSLFNKRSFETFFFWLDNWVANENLIDLLEIINNSGLNLELRVFTFIRSDHS